ncbi:MAG TPA: DNA-deoxyinosine glycosylase [Kofleriaceae bacterium]|jgi:hypoxanthine-DNA glycosylase|nr:DNA-deoxyinosine glycosylase [Kofleriaceae bacterium]
MVTSFSPISSSDARVLVLGTMPGVESLRTGHYYANPRNTFWEIVGGIFGFDAALDYELRCAALRNAKIALWDVLADCERDGSLDSAIKNATPNDFPSFFAQHSSITRVYFNGAKARKFFDRHVNVDRDLVLATLPSTSPANTSRDKLRDWRVIAT